MQHPATSTLSKCILAIAISLPSCIDDKPPSGGTYLVDDEGAAHADALLCATSADGKPRELFVLSAMNRKLQHYADFAAAIGMQSVSTCGGGREFLRRYQEYAAAHPDFDADQPLPELPGRVAPPDGPPPITSVEKILGGVAPQIGGTPIVRLINAQGDFCSGTFIAKNWIATAAHCLSVLPADTGRLPPVKFTDAGIVDDDGRRGTPAARLWGYAKWTIQWPDAEGNLITIKSVVADVLQYPDPDYQGFTEGPSGTGDLSHDFALLYLSPTLYDAKLPHQVHTGAAMRISVRAITDDDDFFFAGFGGPQPPKLRAAAIPLLAGGSADQYVVQAKELITHSSSPRPCKGDSGGPLYRMTPSTDPKGVPVLAGVYGGEGPGGGSDCAEEDSGILSWRRIDARVGYIEKAMRQWNGDLFACRRFPATGSPNYAECWGTPCGGLTNLTCADERFACVQDAKAVGGIGATSCETCVGIGAGGCSCIAGQCLQRSATAPGSTPSQ